MDVSVGVDIGSTSTKILVASPTDDVLEMRQFRSDWFSPVGRTMPRSLIDQLTTQIELALQAAQDSTGQHLRPVGVGISSVAESGILVGADGQDTTQIVPWYDTSGAELIAALPVDFRYSFSAVTGLPLSSQWSLIKLLWFRSQGLVVRGTWLNLGEYVAYRLTGRKFTEPSLASRTGLFHQDTGAPFDAACRLLGSSIDLIPPVRRAGAPWGTGMSGALSGVPITVAGHDHLVAAFANGVIAPNEVFNSSGTADALVRILPERMSAEHRSRMVDDGLTHGWHVVPGRYVLLGGTQGGLVLRRVLDMLGPDRRDELDKVAVAADFLNDKSLGDRVRIVGARLQDSAVVLTLSGDVTTADVWGATLAHVTQALSDVCSRMSSSVGWPENVVAAGGWTRMQSVWLAKQQLFPSIRRSQLSESGAVGAAVLGRHAQNESPCSSGE